MVISMPNRPPVIARPANATTTRQFRIRGAKMPTAKAGGIVVSDTRPKSHPV